MVFNIYCNHKMDFTMTNICCARQTNHIQSGDKTIQINYQQMAVFTFFGVTWVRKLFIQSINQSLMVIFVSFGRDDELLWLTNSKSSILMEHLRPLSFIFVFLNKHYNFYKKCMWKMAIQYMVLGFEPLTFRKAVPSDDHYNSATVLW